MIYRSILETTPHISTVGMEHEAWLKKRTESLGWSDAGGGYWNEQLRKSAYPVLAKKWTCVRIGNEQGGEARKNS
jgi:hypothetical protein